MRSFRCADLRFVARKMEQVGDRIMDRRKALNVSRRLEPPHDQLAPSKWQMRILGPVVLPQALLVASRQAQLRLRCPIRSELIGDERLGREALLPEQFAHELRGRPCIAPSLHKEIENLALVVDRSPEPESSAGDQNRHLIEMPT